MNEYLNLEFPHQARLHTDTAPLNMLDKTPGLKRSLERHLSAAAALRRNALKRERQREKLKQDAEKARLKIEHATANKKKVIKSLREPMLRSSTLDDEVIRPSKEPMSAAEVPNKNAEATSFGADRSIIDGLFDAPPRKRPHPSDDQKVLPRPRKKARRDNYSAWYLAQNCGWILDFWDTVQPLYENEEEVLERRKRARFMKDGSVSAWNLLGGESGDTTSSEESPGHDDSSAEIPVRSTSFDAGEHRFSAPTRDRRGRHCIVLPNGTIHVTGPPVRRIPMFPEPLLVTIDGLDTSYLHEKQSRPAFAPSGERPRRLTPCDSCSRLKIKCDRGRSSRDFLHSKTTCDPVVEHRKDLNPKTVTFKILQVKDTETEERQSLLGH